MATLFYAAWRTAAEVANGPVLSRGTINIAGTSTPSAAVVAPGLGSSTSVETVRVRLFADADCFVNWSEEPSVTGGTDGEPMGAENPEYFDIPANHKIAVILR